MIPRLPNKLAKEPIIDAVFELRMQSSFPLSSVLTGIFFSKLDGEKIIENLPITNLPKQFRDTDPNLKFAPLIKIHWGNFMLLISDQSVAVACKLPYPRWANLKDAIKTVINVIEESNLITGIDRYSMKYVNIIDSSGIFNKADLVNLKMTLGDYTLSNQNFQLRIEIPDNNFISAIQIVSDANVVLPNEESRSGLVIDIDTIINVNYLPSQIYENLDSHLEEIHLASKKLFFSCLSKTALSLLEPQYE